MGTVERFGPTRRGGPVFRWLGEPLAIDFANTVRRRGLSPRHRYRLRLRADPKTTEAAHFAAQPPHAVQTTKKALNMHIKRAVAGVLEYALSQEYQSFDTPEHKAIVNKFIERSEARKASASGVFAALVFP